MDSLDRWVEAGELVLMNVLQLLGDERTQQRLVLDEVLNASILNPEWSGIGECSRE